MRRKTRESNSPITPDESLPIEHDVCVCPHHPAMNKIEGLPSLESVLKNFWDDQREQLKNFSRDDRLNHLPISRVRKILKAEPDVGMVTVDAPALFAMACEYFILELTVRAWMHTQSCERDTIQRCDIFQTVKKSDIYSFLIDRVPFELHGAMPHGPPPPSLEMILPDMNVLLDMNQIPQENLISEPCIKNDRGFDLNVDPKDCTCGFGFCSEDDCEGSCSARELREEDKSDEEKSFNTMLTL